MVTAAMEMDSYLGLAGGHAVHVNAARSDECDDGPEVMAVARGQDATMVMLQHIKRLDKLESKVESIVEKTSSAEAVVCWKYNVGSKGIWHVTIRKCEVCSNQEEQ